MTAHRLLPDALRAVADLFEVANTDPPSQVTAPGGRVEIAETLRGFYDAGFAAALVRVGILGPVEVRASGPMDPSRVPLASEVVTYIAAHAGGVHPGVLAAAIWPRGVTHAVATATIDRVRDWLGDDPDGSARLRTDESGRYLLAPSVAVDWDSLCAKTETTAGTKLTDGPIYRPPIGSPKRSPASPHPRPLQEELASGRTTAVAQS